MFGINVKKIIFLGLMLAAFSVLGAAQAPVSLSMSVKPAKAKAGEKLTAQITAAIGGGWHLYSITQGTGGPVPTRITVDEGVFKAAGAVRGSAPQKQMDPNFGIATETYTGSASFSVPVAVDSSAQTGAQTLSVSVRYQACNDKVCLPPKTLKVSAPVEIIAGTLTAKSPSPSPTATQTPTATPTPNPNIAANTGANKNANLNAAKVNANVAVNSANTNLTNGENSAKTENSPAAVVAQNTNPPSGTTNDLSNQPPPNITGGLDENQSIWSFIWLAMSVGALSLLTPCVFPMIPITVSYFTNHGAGNRAGAIRDAVIYALGIILTFTLLGVALAVVFGAAGINKFAANPYINLVITGIFLSFALSLFGAFHIGIPSSVLNKLDAFQRSKEQTGGTGGAGRVIALLLMGLTFSLTSFTCTAPFVGTLLVTAAQGKWFLPVAGMLAFSTVFALPFFVLALAPQLVAQLPKSGGWLNSVKVVMGLLEVAAAMKFLSNADLVWGWGVFTREVVLASWIAVALLIGLYLLGKFRLALDSPVESLGAVRLLSAIVFLSLGFYFLTGLFGARLGEIESFLPPATGNSLAANKNDAQKSGEPSWITNDLDAALALAKKENKPVFIDFTGYTCTNCRWMEANMFTKDAVKREFDKFVLVRLYTDGEGEPFAGFQELQEKRFGTVALPLYAVLDKDGNTLTTFPGLTRSQDEFVGFLRQNQSAEVAQK